MCIVVLCSLHIMFCQYSCWTILKHFNSCPLKNMSAVFNIFGANLPVNLCSGATILWYILVIRIPRKPSKESSANGVLVDERRRIFYPPYLMMKLSSPQLNGSLIVHNAWSSGESQQTSQFENKIRRKPPNPHSWSINPEKATKP